MMRREHLHYCHNKDRGCKAEFTCHAAPERDEDGPHCPYEGDLFICEDCDSSRCSECGETLNVAQHDDDCSRATQV